MSELIAYFIAAGIAGFIIAYVTYGHGYVRGYADGLNYGRKGLEEYHAHVMSTQARLLDDVRGGAA